MTIYVVRPKDSKLILWNVQRILSLDLLSKGCERVGDYLRTNAVVESDDAWGAMVWQCIIFNLQ